jgi:hypothetical protein
MTANPLHSKLNEFIHKYYLNRGLRGLLLGLSILLAYFLLATVIEYFGHFNTGFRTVLFYLFVALLLWVIFKGVIDPYLRIKGLLKAISQEDAARMIGQHFPEIQDKLLNTLQLQAHDQPNELLLASIDQRIKALQPFVFVKVIDLPASIKRYGRLTLLPLVAIALLLVFQSHIITKSTERLLAHDQYFAKEAPYSFELLSSDLTILKHQDFEIKVELKGKSLPSLLYVVIDGHLIKMEQLGLTTYSYKLLNVTAPHDFEFSDGEFSSERYHLQVMPNPTVQSFEVVLDYPSYTLKTDEALKNIGDLTLPKGTKVSWRINAVDAEGIKWFGFGPAKQLSVQNNQIVHTETVLKSTQYTWLLTNAQSQSKDSVHYQIQVIEDRHPGIVAEQTQDSINPFLYYFYGKADDDYGLSNLYFVYQSKSQPIKQYLPVKMGHSSDEIFYYFVDFKTLKSQLDTDLDNYEYYFEVWDNDAVNGKKSSKSKVFAMSTPSQEALRADAENGHKALKKSMQNTLQELKNQQKQSAELQKELSENQQLNWQQEQKLKAFIEQQKQLEKQIEAIKKEQKQLNDKQNQLSPLDQELLDKQKALEKLMNEVLSPEMKQMLKKLEDLIKQQNKDAIQQELNKMNQANEDLKKQLDRNLEQFKQFELEKRMNEHVDALKQLSEQQKALQQKTADKTADKSALAEEQKKINDAFESLKQEIQKTMEKNQNLESPLPLDATQKDQESIQNELKESAEGIDKKQNKKASQHQQSAADQMDQLAQKMKKNIEQSKDQQDAEDYYTLRQLLENLIELSQEQEALMDQIKSLGGYSPKFVELSAKQRQLKDIAESVEDSLITLSKRQVQIKSVVTKEMSQINYNMDEAIAQFAKVQIPLGLAKQQYVMTGFNNLAVMLSESLKRMQEDMKQKQSKSDKQCQKPGQKPGKPGDKGKPKMGGIKSLQDQINQQMQQMQKAQQQGQQPGSEQFAKIAAQQEALRREVERLQKQLKEEGNGSALGDLDQTKKLMEQQEKDLVNKQLSPETMRRVKDIESRLLEHEKAEREKDTDNQREAEQAEAIDNQMPPAMKAYLEKKAKEMELIKSVPVQLNPYYKDRVRAYFNQLGI